MTVRLTQFDPADYLRSEEDMTAYSPNAPRATIRP